MGIFNVPNEPVIILQEKPAQQVRGHLPWKTVNLNFFDTEQSRNGYQDYISVKTLSSRVYKIIF